MYPPEFNQSRSVVMFTYTIKIEGVCSYMACVIDYPANTKKASFPGLPRFLFFGLCSVYTEAEEREKGGRSGLIHHVCDVRWTRGGCENDVRGRGRYSNMYE